MRKYFFGVIKILVFVFTSIHSNAQDAPFIGLDASNNTIGKATRDSLAVYFEGKRIVGLGEATHGTHEFYEMKRKLIQFLVEDLDYRIIAFESNFDVYSSNAYLDGRENNLGKVIGSFHQIYQTKEVVDLVTWVRQYNSTVSAERKVIIYGIDCENVGRIPQELLTYFQQVDPTFVDEANEILNGLRGKLHFMKRGKYLRGVSKLQKRLVQYKSGYVNLTSERQWQFALKYTDALKVAIKQSAVLSYHSRKNNSSRDQGMANNVKWILDYEGKDSKIILWAHNGHIQKFKYDLEKREDHFRMGQALDDTFQDQYYAVGFDFDKGSFNAVNYLTNKRMQPCAFSGEKLKSFASQFKEITKPCYFTDFNSLKNTRFSQTLKDTEFMRHAGVGFSGEEFSFIKLPVEKAFDALIFFKNTTPSVFINAGTIK